MPADDIRIVDLRQKAELLAERLPPLMIAADRVASTVAQGVHGRRRVGVGETFWQFRPYQPGDSAAAIDWRQSARSDHLFLREQEWEAAESVWLWADASPSMDYRSKLASITKLERAVVLVLAAASLLTRGGERIALLGDVGRPIGGRQGLTQLTRSLPALLAQARPLPPPQALPRYACLVMVSDFLQPLDELRDRIRSFVAMGVRGHLLQVIDPAEESLPFDGRVLFEGMENEGQALIGSVGSVRERYTSLFRAHRDELRQFARSIGWMFAVHHTDGPARVPLLSLYTALGTGGRS